MYRRLSGPQDRVGRVPPPGLDPQTVRPVTNRYTERVVVAHPDSGMKKKGIQLHTLVRIMAGFLNKFLFENIREDARFANRKVRNFDVHEVRLGTKK